jgi:hypothetical protein
VGGIVITTITVVTTIAIVIEGCRGYRAAHSTAHSSLHVHGQQSSDTGAPRLVDQNAKRRR